MPHTKCVVPSELTEREWNVITITSVPWRRGMRYNTYLLCCIAGIGEEWLSNRRMTMLGYICAGRASHASPEILCLKCLHSGHVEAWYLILVPLIPCSSPSGSRSDSHNLLFCKCFMRKEINSAWPQEYTHYNLLNNDDCKHNVDKKQNHRAASKF